MLDIPSNKICIRHCVQVAHTIFEILKKLVKDSQINNQALIASTLL
jgi:hypothetical protein